MHQRWVSFTEVCETLAQEFETKILKLIDKQSKGKTMQKNRTVKSESRAQLIPLRGTCFLCSNAFTPWPCHHWAVGTPDIPLDHQLIKDRVWHIFLWTQARGVSDVSFLLQYISFVCVSLGWVNGLTIEALSEVIHYPPSLARWSPLTVPSTHLPLPSSPSIISLSPH